jgi:hypothetical protein
MTGRCKRDRAAGCHGGCICQLSGPRKKGTSVSSRRCREHLLEPSRGRVVRISPDDRQDDDHTRLGDRGPAVSRSEIIDHGMILEPFGTGVQTYIQKRGGRRNKHQMDILQKGLCRSVAPNSPILVRPRSFGPSS